MPYTSNINPVTTQFTIDDFAQAGQDSWNTGPGQIPTDFEKLTNILPVTRNSLERRWGYGRLGTGVLSGARRIYQFQSDNTGARLLAVCSPTTVSFLDESGTVFNSNVLGTLSSGAGIPRMVMSRSFGYFVDGVVTDLKKSDGSSSGGVSNWGITSPLDPGTSVASSGPKSAGLGTNLPIPPRTLSANQFTNPNNIVAADASYATALVNDNSGTFYPLMATGFGFALPTNAIILGIKVEVKAYYS